MAARTTLAFAGFELDTATEELRRDGQRVPLQPQPLRLLAYLASRPGELVTRTELQKLVWGEVTEVDVEHGLNFCIAQIRSALLAGGAEGLLETLPRRGYRFGSALAPVAAPGVARSADDPVARMDEPATRGPAPVTPPSAGHVAPRRWRAAAIAAVALLVSSGITWAVLHRATRQRAREHLAAVEARRQARALLQQPDRDAVKRSIAAYEQALLLDPGLPGARAELAEAYLHSAQGDLWGKEAMSRARALATEALRADPGSAVAETTLGLVLLQLDWAWDEAREHLERGVLLDPQRPEGRMAQALYLSAAGRPSEAVTALAPVVNETSPNFLRSELAWHHYFARDYEAALALWRRVLDEDATAVWPRMQVLSSLVLLGREAEAYAEAKVLLRVLGAPPSRVEKVTRLPPADAIREFFRGRAQNQASSADAGAAVDPCEVATLWAQSGDRERALTWLERAVRERSRWLLPLAPADPVLDGLRDDPRYQVLRAGWDPEREHARRR